MTGKVMIVDDNPQNVKLLEAKLADEYYTTFSVYNGKECLEKVANFAPDIILLDIMMPEMDGFEVCRRLKSDPATSQIPVVMVTALNETHDRVNGLNAGADDFITKPIDEIHLFARVKSLIRLKTMTDELLMRDRTGSQLGMDDIFTKAGLTGKILGDIVVVDDDIVRSRNIDKGLKALGHNVKMLEHHQLLDEIKEGNCDLVIISTLLDDVDGLRLAMSLRTAIGKRQLPILVMIDDGDKPILVKALEIGIDDYIMLPLDMNEMIVRVASQIKRKRFQDALRSNLAESVSASIVDPLTKLYNRRYLDAHLKNILDDAKQKGLDLSVMTLDIDHFKSVNDKPGWGHHIGDEVLKEVAQRIMNAVRTTDLPTRPGGEEFVVIMPGIDLERAMMVAERTRKKICETPMKISAEPFQYTCTASIGVATVTSDINAPEALLKMADEALYQAKQTGRNRVIKAAGSAW
jgi:two-component system, cell cycle response regulator